MASPTAQSILWTTIAGFHVSAVLPELMHAGALGVTQVLSGSILKELCDAGVWGDGVGAATNTWQQQMQNQLIFAFEEFCAWTRAHHKPHTQKRFTVASMSLTTRLSWPCLKGKAHNALVVQEWLAHKTKEVCESDCSTYAALRACVAWGFATFHHVVRRAGAWLSSADVEQIRSTAPFVLGGYNALSAAAREKNVP
eukprot:6232560-Lingulodinium_polyedra.AAC.1